MLQVMHQSWQCYANCDVLPVENPVHVCYGRFIGFCCGLQNKVAHSQEGEYHRITGRFFLHFQDGSGKRT
jgi:hypothetical protein